MRHIISYEPFSRLVCSNRCLYQSIVEYDVWRLESGMKPEEKSPRLPDGLYEIEHAADDSIERTLSDRGSEL